MKSIILIRIFKYVYFILFYYLVYNWIMIILFMVGKFGIFVVFGEIYIYIGEFFFIVVWSFIMFSCNFGVRIGFNILLFMYNFVGLKYVFSYSYVFLM